ncbi:MAG: hypothetical protein OQK04_19925 [Kangiellaceae bacterium]|nr:hypothetical protein [Kangiellaceae bacterium]MCW9000990.1 hypothetical protein [Kangiellaceae bacterium]
MHRILSTLFLLLLSAQSAHSAVLVKDKMWPQNTQLTIVFLDGSFEQKQLVKRVIPAWFENSALSFKVYQSLKQAPEKTHIRISFQSHTGSMLGDHGDYYSTEPTLLLDELNQKDLHPQYATRYILHEFGHALGFEHEYRSPNWPFGEKARQVHLNNCIPRMADFGLTLADAQQKCVEINSPLNKHDTNSTAFDNHSIMNYPQTIKRTGKSDVYIKAKHQLSALDKLAIERWYGK